MTDLPKHVDIHEEGPREAFQIEPGPISTAAKIKLIEALADSICTSAETDWLLEGSGFELSVPLGWPTASNRLSSLCIKGFRRCSRVVGEPAKGLVRTAQCFVAGEFAHYGRPGPGACGDCGIRPARFRHRALSRRPALSREFGMNGPAESPRYGAATSSPRRPARKS